MEHQLYTPEQIQFQKKKNTIFLIILILPLLIGLMLVMDAVIELATTQVINISTIPYQNVSEKTEYYFEDLVILECYNDGSYNDYDSPLREINQNSEFKYNRDYLARFTDINGEFVYTNICTDGFSDLDEYHDAYTEENSEVPKGIVFSGCFHARSTEKYEPLSSFTEAYKRFNEETPGELLNWKFTYDELSTPKAYHKELANNRSSLILCGFILMGFCIYGDIVLFDKQKMISRYLMEYKKRK